jgi:hypothetical protein
MKVWLVGVKNVETSNVHHVCLSEKTANKLWEETRKELRTDCIERFEYSVIMGYEQLVTMYKRQVDNLDESDPKKLHNYPHDEPFISDMET